ncbi:hypothetical protein GF356_08845 [candidate division GN15 bacterium]|nr:hypothetical protein [candidate division GN15 bacterium]
MKHLIAQLYGSLFGQAEDSGKGAPVVVSVASKRGRGRKRSTRVQKAKRGSLCQLFIPNSSGSNPRSARR